MQIQFSLQEKRIVREQLHEMALNAASLGEKQVYKRLQKISNTFEDNNEYSVVKNHEARMLLDAMVRTSTSLDMILQKINESDKSKEEKEKSIEKTKVLMSTTNSVIFKLQGKLDDSNKEQQ